MSLLSLVGVCSFCRRHENILSIYEMMRVSVFPGLEIWKALMLRQNNSNQLLPTRLEQLRVRSAKRSRNERDGFSAARKWKITLKWGMLPNTARQETLTGLTKPATSSTGAFFGSVSTCPF
jgi:hypothetical protein